MDPRHCDDVPGGMRNLLTRIAKADYHEEPVSISRPSRYMRKDDECERKSVSCIRDYERGVVM